MTIDRVLAARGVRFAYPDGEAVLHGVDLGLDRGDVVALTGASGSGKSTLLYCLSGILRPTGGSVFIDGIDLAMLGDEDRTRLRAEKMGFVLQFGRLVPELSAVENVSLPLRILGARRGAAERAAVDLLRSVGLAALGERRVGSLSGGQQQRVAVARAIVHEPAVVFADEPTGALDSANGAVVMDLLVDLARSRGAAVVLVTHDAGIAARADSEIRLSDGFAERLAERA